MVPTVPTTCCGFACGFACLIAPLSHIAHAAHIMASLRLAIKASLEQSQPPALPQQTTRKRGKGPPSKKSKATAAGPPSWTRGDVQLRPTRATLRGLNVQRPWAPMLLDGSKVIETRTYDIDKQKCFANEWFWVVETPGKKRQRGQRAHITGCIKFSSESVRYTSLAQWRADEDKHRIPAGSEYDWNGRGAMYGWRVERAYALRSPLPRPCLLYTSPSPRDQRGSRMPSSA